MHLGTKPSFDRREREIAVLFQQLDQYATGDSIHRVANLKTNYLAALDLYHEDGDQKSLTLLRNVERSIQAFLTKARLRAVFFS